MGEQIILESEMKEANIVLENESNNINSLDIYSENEEKEVCLEAEGAEELNIDLQNEVLDEQNIDLENEFSKIGSEDYEKLTNKPLINNVELIGNKTLNDLGIQPKGNYAEKRDIPDTSEFIKDSNYVHTDNNYTDEEKEKLEGIDENANNYVLPNDVVQDEDYTHTDNNFTDEDKNKLLNAPKHSDILDITGDLQHLNTEDTSNLVNAINETLAKGGIPELVNQSINIYDLAPGIYLLSGMNTKIYRGTYAWWTNPISSAMGKALLFLTRHAKNKEQGFLFNSYSGSPYNRIFFFDGATKKEYNMMTLLTINNTSSYTVSGSYQPAHKQYVDNAINNLRGELGGINDLGWVDMDDYGGDIFSFIDTLTNEGTFVFVDSIDDFSWRIEVQVLGNRIGQKYWNTEEGYNVQYYREGLYNEDDDTYEWFNWQS